MKYLWTQATAFVGRTEPLAKPPLIKVLAELQEDGWEIFAILPIPDLDPKPSVTIVARRQDSGHRDHAGYNMLETG